MTSGLRRLRVVYFALALGFGALSALGWLRPDLIAAKTSGFFAGLSVSFAVFTLACALMPRWWKEQADEEYDSRASRDYRRQVLPAMAAYVVAVFAAPMLLKAWALPLPLRALVAVAPVLPIAAVLRAFLHYLRDIDEFKRRIELESVGIAAMLVSLAYLAGGFLQMAKIIALPAGPAMFWVFPLMCVGYGIGKFLTLRRYR